MKSRLIKYFFLFAAAISFVAFSSSLRPAIGADSGSVDDLRLQIEQKSKEIEELEKKAQELNQEISKQQSKAKTLKNEISQIEAKIKKLNNDVRITQTKISQSILSIEKISIDIGEKKEGIDRHKNYLADILRTLNEYENEGQLIIFLKNGQLSDFLDQMEYVGGLEKELNYNIEEITALKDQQEAQKSSLEGQKKDLERQKKNLSGQKTTVEDQKDGKDSLLKETQNQEKNYQALLKEVEKKRQGIEAEMYQLEEKMRSIVAPGQIPPPRAGMFIGPIDNGRLTQGYGMTSFAKAGAYGGGPHTGVDIDGGYGAPVKAAKDGIVRYGGDLGRYSYGRWLAVEHDNGLTTLYGHLSSKTVAVGQKVQTGDIIGYEGSTGYSTGAHLHFGVYLTSTLRLSESKVVKGLMLPTGYHINPSDYL